MLFVTSMFRSGSTYLARALNSNRHIACASDPIFPIFKAIRNRVVGVGIDCPDPISDYSLVKEKEAFYRGLLAFDFSTSLEPAEHDQLIDAIRAHSADYSRALSEQVKSRLVAKNFRGLFQQTFDLVRSTYGSPDTKVCGIKEVWTDDFMHPLLEDGHISKCIHILRDPRAVAASNYVSSLCYPNLFLARQWRKSAALARLNSERHSDAYLIVKYEDLILKKKSTFERICEFLEVRFDISMLDDEKLTDGEGKRWSQNSSYTSSKAQIHRWKQSIPSGHQAVIEFICRDGMSHFGYDFQGAALPPTLSDLNNLGDTQIAGWIKPYCDYDYPAELELEISRQTDFSKDPDSSFFKAHYA